MESDLVMKPDQCLCYMFLLSISFVRCLDRAQNTNGIEIHMEN